jgi:hypothetical protein
MHKVSEKVAVVSIVAMLISMIVLSLIFNLELSRMGMMMNSVNHTVTNSEALLQVLIIASGLYVLVVWPALSSRREYLRVLILGIVFGLSIFGPFDVVGGCEGASWSTRAMNLLAEIFCMGLSAVFATFVPRRLKFIK